MWFWIQEFGFFFKRLLCFFWEEQPTFEHRQCLNTDSCVLRPKIETGAWTEVAMHDPISLDLRNNRSFSTQRHKHKNLLQVIQNSSRALTWLRELGLISIKIRNPPARRTSCVLMSWDLSKVKKKNGEGGEICWNRKNKIKCQSRTKLKEMVSTTAGLMKSLKTKKR